MRTSFNLVNAPTKLLPQVKEKLRQKVPLLTATELRRVKEPLRKALILELQEQGRPKALQIFEKILETDQKNKKFFHNKKNDKLLLEIFEDLLVIEEKLLEEEVNLLVNISWRIWDRNEEIDWLIEFLLIEATERIIEYRLEGTKVDAITKFAHGLSLHYRLHWHRAALLHFEYAFKLAQRHDEWTFNDKKLLNTIAIEFSKCAVEFSKELRKDKNQIKNAIFCSKQALLVLRHDLKKENLFYEFHAEFEHASCWFDADNYETALSHFEHAAAIAEQCLMNEKYCECLLEIAKCYHVLKSREKQKIFLDFAKKIADENELVFLNGKIAAEIMKFYMELYDMENVEKYFYEAQDSFKKSRCSDKLVEIEEIYARFQASPYFNNIVDTILKIDKRTSVKDHDDVIKLINWMDKKSSEIFKSKSKENLSLDKFIKFFYDPDEVVQMK